jgi:hypothetical protein
LGAELGADAGADLDAVAPDAGAELDDEPAGGQVLGRARR